MRTSVGGSRGTAWMRTSGVLPTRSRTLGVRPGVEACSVPPVAVAPDDMELGLGFHPAGDCRDDRDLVAFLHRGVETREEANVLAVHVEVDETAHFAGVVADALFQAGMPALDVLDDRGDGAATRGDALGAPGELAKRGGDTNRNRHVGVSFLVRGRF